MTEPYSVSVSSGLPIFIFETFSMNFSRNVSYIFSLTNILEPHKQTCPELVNAAFTAPDTAVSMSASAHMIVAFFPPNSNEIFLNSGDAVAATIFPVAVPPVNEIALISGCSRIG